MIVSARTSFMLVASLSFTLAKGRVLLSRQMALAVAHSAIHVPRPLTLSETSGVPVKRRPSLHWVLCQ
jgi:hypothetical protein